MRITVRAIDWERTSVFRIAYATQTHSRTVQVELRDGALVGRGEAMGVPYHGETVETIVEQLTNVEADIRNGVSRQDLQSLLPAGGARNLLDCALWDLEAKRKGRRAWELAGLLSVRALVTTYTLGLDAPEPTARAAAALTQYPKIKLKLDGDCDFERVALVRKARPDVELLVDANQSWSEKLLLDLAPKLVTLGVSLIEQPLPVSQDAALADFESPIPLCADESCQTAQSLPALCDKYDYVNVKLDKTGGLTEALNVAKLAKEQGLKVMAGCMGGSSLAMAPAFVVAQLCDVVDLDGPLLIKSDMPDPICYEGGRMFEPAARLWG